MKAIVLAGGHATRLWPLTKHRAKPLLPLGRKPIIAYVLDQLQEMDVEDVLISTNAKYADDFEQFLAAHDYNNTRVVVEDHTREEEKIGSLGAIMQIVKDEGADDYLVVGGDNYTSLDLAEFAGSAQERDAPTIACYEVDTREDATAFGVVDTDSEQQVTGFVEKPEEPPSRLVSTLFYYFPASSMDLFDRYRDAHEGSDENYLDEPGRLIEWAHDRETLYAYAFDGEWHDIGTPQNYLQAQAAMTDGFTAGNVTQSSLGDNVWVMDGAKVEDADLENCIVFPGATIVDATVKDSIVDEEATVQGKDLDGAVIGAHSTVR